MSTEWGSGETYFRFDPADMDKNGHGLSDFSHAIVAAVSVNDEREPLHPVLKGELDMPPYREEPSSREKLSSREEEEVTGEDPDLTCYNSYYNKYIAAQCFRMDRDKNVYDRVMPFKNDVTGAEWTKVTGDLTVPMVSPGAQMLAQKYKHYIFGKTEKYY